MYDGARVARAARGRTHQAGPRHHQAARPGLPRVTWKNPRGQACRSTRTPKGGAVAVDGDADTEAAVPPAERQRAARALMDRLDKVLGPMR